MLCTEQVASALLELTIPSREDGHEVKSSVKDYIIVITTSTMNRKKKLK